MFNLLWLAFKLLFSLLLVLVAGSLLIAPSTAVDIASRVGIAGGLVFFAALPWVITKPMPQRATGLVAMVLSMLFGVLATNILTGEKALPQSCTGRKVFYCNLENALFNVGGAYLAATPLVLLTLALLAGGIFLVVKHSRRGSRAQ